MNLKQLVTYIHSQAERNALYLLVTSNFSSLTQFRNHATHNDLPTSVIITCPSPPHTHTRQGRHAHGQIIPQGDSLSRYNSNLCQDSN